MKSRLPSLAAAAFVVMSMHASAGRVDAQISTVGSAHSLFGYGASPGTGFNPTTDAAYDPQRDVYLVISGYEGLWGIFVDGAGNVLGYSFRIVDPSGSDTRFAESPHVIYSADLSGGGGFLVTWANRGRGGLGISVRAVIVTYPIGISGGGSVWRPTEFAVAGPVVAAYSRTSHQFLVAWTTQTSIPSAGYAFEIYARPVGLDAQPIGPSVHVGTGRVTAIAWHPERNEFAIAYRPFTGDMDAHFVRLTLQGEVVLDEIVNLSPVPSTDTMSNPLLAVNDSTGNYVMVWSQRNDSTSEYKFFTAEIDSQGRTIAMGSEALAVWATSLSFNTGSRTFAVLTSCASGACALELNEYGERISELTPVASVARWPQAASGADGEWLLADADKNRCCDTDYATAFDQLLATSVRDGGPAGVPLTDLCVGSDPFTFMGGGVCVNGGWVPWNHPAAQRGGSVVPPTPPPGGCTTPDPFTFFGGGVCVNGGWVPKDHPLAKR